jgi:hypothetical protein
VVAADAGLMQIQLWEGTVLRCATAALRSMTCHTADPENGYGETVARKLSLMRLQEGICFPTRRRGAQRAEARGVLELESVVSCGRAHLWGRTKLDFGSGEPFDDLHWSSTLGTAIKIGNVFGGGSVFFGKRFLCRTQQLEA